MELYKQRNCPAASLLSVLLERVLSKYPPAEPGALIGERLKGALKP